MSITLKGGNIKSGQAAKDVFEHELKPKDIANLFVKVLLSRQHPGQNRPVAYQLENAHRLGGRTCCKS
jgi:hypothetical protein